MLTPFINTELTCFELIPAFVAYLTSVWRFFHFLAKTRKQHFLKKIRNINMSEPRPNTKSKTNILVSSHQQANIAYYSDKTLLETSE